MIQNTGSFPAGLRPLAKKWFGVKHAEWAEEFSQVFGKVPSDKAYEDYVGTTSYGLAKAKNEGSPFDWDSVRQGFTARINNISFSLGAIITYEQMKDGVWMPATLKQTAGLARSFRLTKENFFALFLSRAFTAGYVGADGLVMCSTAHLNKSDNTTYSNRLTVDADLSELALEQACIQISKLQDDRGNPEMIRPKKLVVRPEDLFEAERIMKSTLQSGTGNNDINALRSTGAIPGGYTVNHFFDAGNGAWFITTDIPADEGLIYQEREAISFGQDNEFTTRNFQMMGFERYGGGWANPKAIFGSAGAA